MRRRRRRRKECEGHTSSMPLLPTMRLRAPGDVKDASMQRSTAVASIRSRYTACVAAISAAQREGGEEAEGCQRRRSEMWTGLEYRT